MGKPVSNVICQGDIHIRVSTGKTDLTDITCKNLTSDGSTGNVRFNGSDAGEIFAKTDIGNIELDVP